MLKEERLRTTNVDAHSLEEASRADGIIGGDAGARVLSAGAGRRAFAGQVTSTTTANVPLGVGALHAVTGSLQAKLLIEVEGGLVGGWVDVAGSSTSCAELVAVDWKTFGEE